MENLRLEIFKEPFKEDVIVNQNGEPLQIGALIARAMVNNFAISFAVSNAMLAYLKILKEKNGQKKIDEFVAMIDDAILINI